MNTDRFRLENDLVGISERDKMFRIFFFESDTTVKVSVDFASYPISTPSLVFVSENELFQLQDETHRQLKGRVLFFSNDFFCIKLNRSETFCDAVIFNTTKPPYITLGKEEAKKIDYLFLAMSNELKEDNEFKEEIIISQLKTLLLHASKIKLNQFGDVNLSKLSPIVANFQNLLDQQYEDHHDVQFYASQLNISPRGLNKAVKKELGRTVSELIKEKLIVEAKRELYIKELSIKEIGYKLGFEDPAYFSRFFKKETAYSPKEYADLL